MQLHRCRRKRAETKLPFLCCAQPWQPAATARLSGPLPSPRGAHTVRHALRSSRSSRQASHRARAAAARRGGKGAARHLAAAGGQLRRQLPLASARSHSAPRTLPSPPTPSPPAVQAASAHCGAQASSSSARSASAALPTPLRAVMPLLRRPKACGRLAEGGRVGRALGASRGGGAASSLL